MLALISNYQIPRGLDYSDPYEIMFEAVEKVFGESKRIEWWLEHPLNHTPKDLMVRCRYRCRTRDNCTDEGAFSGLNSNRSGYVIGIENMVTMTVRHHFR